jgi:hypothetical protein
MNEENSADLSGYIFVGILGAIGGAFLVTIATKALPKMMADFMHQMMSRRGAGSLAPSEF